MSDPFAHGTPVGDDHSWVRPPAPDCPNCGCCTEQLCARANDFATSCAVWVNGTPANGVMDVSKCPCTATPAGGKQ